MGRGDLRLLSRRAHLCVEAGKRVGLVKLTVPFMAMPAEWLIIAISLRQ